MSNKQPDTQVLESNTDFYKDPNLTYVQNKMIHNLKVSFAWEVENGMSSPDNEKHIIHLIDQIKSDPNFRITCATVPGTIYNQGDAKMFIKR